MELALLILAAVGLVAVTWWAGMRRADPSAFNDARLARQWADYQKRLERAAHARPGQHDAVVRRMAPFAVAMKARGLVPGDHFPEEPLLQYKLEQVARERFASTVRGIRQLASQGNPAGLYQLAMLLRSVHEEEVASGYLQRAADAGHADAQFALALQTMGIEDGDEAGRATQSLTLLQAAANQGHEQARKAMAGLLKSLPPLAARAALRAARRRAELSAAEPAPAAAATPPEPALAPAGGLPRTTRA